MTTAKVFDMMHGVWSITRTIAGYGFMNGTAKFERTINRLDELVYKENGLFMFDNGNKAEAHKEYLYRLNKKTNELEIYFADNNNRLFHTLKFNDHDSDGEYLTANAVHECSNDIYKIKYEIFGDNEFKIIYTVNGPSKDYVSETYFIKK